MKKFNYNLKKSESLIIYSKNLENIIKKYIINDKKDILYYMLMQEYYNLKKISFEHIDIIRKKYIGYKCIYNNVEYILLRLHFDYSYHIMLTIYDGKDNTNTQTVSFKDITIIDG